MNKITIDIDRIRRNPSGLRYGAAIYDLLKSDGTDFSQWDNAALDYKVRSNVRRYLAEHLCFVSDKSDIPDLNETFILAKKCELLKLLMQHL